MRPIPPEMKLSMAQNPFYRKCCVPKCNSHHVEWHHQLAFGGQQVNEEFAILPLCKHHHSLADTRYMEDLLDYIMLSRATKDEIERYSKVRNLRKRKKSLEDFAAKNGLR